MDPAARSARVRQRDRRRPPPLCLDRVFTTNDGVERLRAEKAVDRQPSDGHDQRRPDHAELVVQPAGALRPLGWRWNAVAPTGGMRTRVTTGDRRDVEQITSGGLVEPGALEPAEEGAARAAGERLAT